MEWKNTGSEEAAGLKSVLEEFNEIFALEVGRTDLYISSAHNQHGRTCTCQTSASTDPILFEKESTGNGG